MAEHVAEQIIQAGKTALTGLTTTGANVFDSKVYPVQESELPALLIDQGSEDVEVLTLTPPLYNRRLEVLVYALAKQTSGYRTLMNTIRKEVEAAIGIGTGLGGAKAWVLTGIDADVTGEGDQPIARATIRFEVQYCTAAGAADVAV